MAVASPERTLWPDFNTSAVAAPGALAVPALGSEATRGDKAIDVMGLRLKGRWARLVVGGPKLAALSLSLPLAEEALDAAEPSSINKETHRL
jgi:hypothetical protein